MTISIKNLLAFREHISECPHPEKSRFTKAKAQRRADQLGMKKYKCVCGKWHLTSCEARPSCPICRAPYDEYTSCGCYEDITYGRD